MKHKDLYILKKRVHHHEELKSHPYINYSSIITCAYMGFKKKKKLELYFFDIYLNMLHLSYMTFLSTSSGLHQIHMQHNFFEQGFLIFEHSSPILQGQGITWVPQGALTHK